MRLVAPGPYLLCLLLVVSAALPADDGGDKGADKTDADRYRVLPIPIFITEPAIGEGLGLALALFHPVKKGKSVDARLGSLSSVNDYTTSREAPPVVTAIAGGYTSNDTWFAGVGHTNNWRNDSIRYNGLLATARINSRVYLASLPIRFSMDTTAIFQNMKFRVAASDFMIGGSLSYMDADTAFGLGLPEDGGQGRFSSDFTNSGVSVLAAYETRDNSMNPRSGQFVEMTLWRYDEAFGGDYDYWNMKLKALSFHSLSDKLTLGLRLEVSAVTGDVPFFAVPWVSLRGIPALRYQNKFAGAVETEIRYRLRPRWEVSVFGGAGFTGDQYPIYENPGSIYNFGLGGRYNVFQEHNVWLGVDLARGPEDWNWYVQVGHPW